MGLSNSLREKMEAFERRIYAEAEIKTVHDNHDQSLNTGNSLVSRNQRNHEISNFVEDHDLMTGFKDIVDFVGRHAACRLAVTQWGAYPQALTNAIKRYGPAKVIQAIKFTQASHAAKNKSAFMFAVLRNGIRQAS